MALLAEDLVEEWLNRKGYFTIRGIKVGVHEIDLLAVRQGNGDVECRHIEVQASMRPISFITRLPKEAQKTGRAANSQKRSSKELAEGVAEWVETKFRRPEKMSLMKSLWDGKWSKELVLGVVKSEEEVKLIEGRGVTVLRLKEIISSLANAKKDDFVVESATGGALVDLIGMAIGAQPITPGQGPQETRPEQAH